MSIAFYGGQTAGIIVLLTILSNRQHVKYVVAEDQSVESVARLFQLPLYSLSQLDNPVFIKELKKNINFFISCHGRKILKPILVNSIRCINLHPCLYKYKGAYPIRRLIEDKNPKASVASHWMVEKVDSGKTIVEEFKQISDITKKSEAEVYNELYPVYVDVILKTLDKL